MKKLCKFRAICLLAAVFAAGFFYPAVNAACEAQDISGIYVRLRYEGSVWEYRYPDVVYRGGLDEEIEVKFEKDFRGRLLRQTAPLSCKYGISGLTEKLEEISKTIDSEPENGEVIFYPDSDTKFELRPDVKGKKLNTQKLAKEIDSALSKGRSADIELKPDTVEAEYTAEKLKRSFSVRRQFSTDFSASSPERKHNIALSLSKFNGIILPPNAEISFNKTVGPRTEQRGYKTAKIIVGGDFVEGVGGGVCQTSTTIYNAMLLAGVKVTEHHNHSLAVSYVPPSFDAMVNISSADLKFYNDTGNFLYLKTWCEGGRAFVRIYGEKCPYRIERRSSVIKTYETPKEKTVIDKEGKYPDIYEGERKVVLSSKPKTQSIGELLYYKNDKLIKVETIRKDTYSQLIGKEIIGTAKRPKTFEESLNINP